MEKKPMKNEKVLLEVKRKISIHEKISIAIMMVGALALAGGLIVGLVPRDDGIQVTESTELCSSLDCWESFTVTFNSSDHQISKPDEEGYQTISMNDFNTIGVPGEPNLPTKLFSVLLPPNAIYKDFEIVGKTQNSLEGEYVIEATPTPQPITAVDSDIPYEPVELIQPDQEIYQSNQEFPESVIKVNNSGKLGKYSVQGFTFTPYRYKPLSKELALIESVSVRVYYEEGLALNNESIANTVMDAEARSFLINYDQYKDKYAPPDGNVITGTGSTYQNVIIIPESLSGSHAIIDYEDYRESQGYSLLVVTVESIDANYIGADISEKIRNYLIDQYDDLGFDFVTLIGTHDVIPMKYCYFGSEIHGMYLPTDYYYQDLNGVWEQEEYMCGGGIDWYPELFVGRIPLDTESELQEYVDRVIAYEQSEDPYKKKALMAAGILYEYRDGATIAEEIADNIFLPNEYEVVRAYEEDGDCPTVYAHEYEADRSIIASHWADNYYGIVFFSSHGNPGRLCSDPCPQASWPCVSIFEGSDVEDLNNNYPAIIYGSACDTAHPEDPNTLGYRFIRQGGVSYIGASRVAYLSGSRTYYHYFYNLVTRGIVNSKAHGLYRAEIGPFDKIEALEFNVFGDPLLSVQSEHVYMDEPEVTEFFSPGYSTVDVTGTVAGIGFLNYVLEWGQGLNPTTWSSDGIVLEDDGANTKIENLLGSWDISSISMDGDYTLRLQATFGEKTVYKDQYFHFTNYAEISEPETTNLFVPNVTSVDLEGLVTGVNFDYYALEWGEGQHPISWSSEGITLADGGTQIKINEVIGAWDISNIDTAGDYTVRLTGHFGTEEMVSTLLFHVNMYLQWGELGTGQGQFNTPERVKYFDSEIFVADTKNNRIQVFDDHGIFLRQWGQAGTGDGYFNNPRGVAEYLNEIYVVDTNNHRIQVFDSNGNFIRKMGLYGISGDGRLNKPYDISVAGGEVYIADRVNHQIQVFDTNGNFLRRWGSQGSETGQFTLPSGIAVYKSEVYVADMENSRVQVFNTQGVFRRQIGTQGVDDGELNYPTDITIEYDTLYIVNAGSSRIQVLDTWGNFIRAFGVQGSEEGEFANVQGVDVFNGRIFTADAGNNRIQAFGKIQCADCTETGITVTTGDVLAYPWQQNVLVPVYLHLNDDAETVKEFHFRIYDNEHINITSVEIVLPNCYHDQANYCSFRNYSDYTEIFANYTIPEEYFVAGESYHLFNLVIEMKDFTASTEVALDESMSFIKDASNTEIPVSDITYLPGNIYESALLHGDINLNGIPNEIGDGVLLSNYFMYGMDIFDESYTDEQIAQTDINFNCTTLEVEDLDYLMSIISGDEDPIINENCSSYASSAAACSDGTPITKCNVTGQFCFKEELITKGDLNGDGKIDPVDVVTFVNYFYRNMDLDEKYEAAANVNGDNSINDTDLHYLVNYVYRSGPAPVCQ